MASVYDINKGINRSIEFKGIKAQYISYLAIGLVILLIVFAILYSTGLSLYLSLGIILPAAIALIGIAQRLSRRYGQHGLTKRMAARQLPSSLQCHSRRFFTSLNSSSNAPHQTI